MRSGGNKIVYKDLVYCGSSYLMFRTIFADGVSFDGVNLPVRHSLEGAHSVPIDSSSKLLSYLKKRVAESTADGKAALALSGGIDSAILARLMPKGSTAYTFKCVVPGVEVTDESARAATYAKECGLIHKIVEITWDDVETTLNKLMKSKHSPIHSIEIQIYKAALQAKSDGFDRLIFGEAADTVYGGLSGLLSKDWLFGDFVERYSYVMPYKVLKESKLILEPFLQHQVNGYVPVHEFLQDVFFPESTASYLNACILAGVDPVLPYAETRLSNSLDLSRIRNGENKYLVREVFSQLYPDFEIPIKTPMPRPTTEWFKNWSGPKRPEFLPHCIEGMSGDQRWLIFCLERYLDMINA